MFFILGRLIALTFCVCSLFEHECNAFDLHVWLLKFCLEHACDVTHTCIWINPKREINQTIEQKRVFFLAKTFICLVEVLDNLGNLIIVLLLCYFEFAYSLNSL